MTSRPVPIPASRTLNGTTGRHNRDHGPFFGLIDTLENGEATWLLSDGSGRFIQLRPCEPVPHLVFIIEKRRNVRHLVVEILTETLKRVVRTALGRADIPGSALELDITTLIAHYGALKEQLDNLYNTNLLEAVELNLLVHGCLLDQSLYHGADTPLHQAACSPGGRAYLQDILHEKLMQGFDELNECFQLGQLSDEATTVEMSVFNHRFEQLAYAGNLYALQDHVEPAVRSGEVEVQHDNAFLANVLAGGHSVTHQYLIDLSQRTLSSNIQDLKSENRDVSTDPMYKAIKRGQTQSVKLCVMNRQFFAGFISQDQERPPLPYVTPIVAAVLWERVDILQLLLDAGPPYLDGWSHAISWAAGYQSGDMLSIMNAFQKQHMGSLHRPEFSPSPYFGVNSTANYLGIPPQKHNITHMTSAEPSRGVSEISNRIAGLGWDETLRRFEQSSVFSSGASTPNLPPSSWTADTMRSSSQASAFPAYHIVQPSSGQTYRMKLGRDLVHKLEVYCDTLKTSLAAAACDTSAFMSCFSSAKSVWKSGLDAARRLLCNQPPANMTEVLQLLLIAQALGSSVSETNRVGGGDRDRWRTAVSLNERPVFDELVRMALGDTGPSNCTPSSDISELWRIQELAQNLVSTDMHEGGKSDTSALRGLRLPFFYGCHYHWQKSDANHSEYRGRAISSCSIVDVHSLRDTDSWTNWNGGQQISADDEDFNLFDYIKVEAVQEEEEEEEDQPGSASQGRQLEKDSSWKSIAPTIVLLLGSQEFSMILHAIERVQLPNDRGLPSSTEARVPFAKSEASTALEKLEQFCSIALPSTTGNTANSFPGTPPDGVYVSLIPTMKAWILGGRASEDKLSQSLDPYFLQCGTERRGLCNEDTTIASSLSSSVPSSKPSKALERLRCQSLGCPKTFSNVSNRNKHMREGCAFRDTPKYPCRNAGCSKTLTTKWYRSTHELTRCRYRPTLTGQGSPHADEDSVMGGVAGA